MRAEVVKVRAERERAERNIGRRGTTTTAAEVVLADLSSDHFDLL